MKYLALIVFLIGSTVAYSQIKGFESLEGEDVLQQTLEKNTLSGQSLRIEDQPAGNIVSDEYYRIGPGDILSIQIAPDQLLNNIVHISPEVSLMIPVYGVVDLKGLTLKEAKEKITEFVKNVNSAAEVSVSLRKARNVIVTISGNVNRPGTFYLPASYSVSSAVKIANKITSASGQTTLYGAAVLRKLERGKDEDKYYSESGLAKENSYSKRNIYIKHVDGTSEVADLEKARVLKDHKFDPFVREGDEILVPFVKDDYPIISISGAVLNPVTTAYKNGDKISMLLKMASGLLENADPDNIQLHSGDHSTKLNVDKDLNLLSSDAELEPNSIITVGMIKPKRAKPLGVVSVKGEVIKPGVYTIEPQKTRLKDVIDKAGGFTGDEYLPLANIIRKSKHITPSINYRQDILEYFQHSDLKLEDTTRYMIDIMLLKPYVSSNFDSLFNYGQSRYNILLEDGDVINVPTKPTGIFVFGQVIRPGYVDFVPGKTIEWYIEKAGGYASGSDPDKARIIRGLTKVWDENGIVMAGDEVYVPRVDDVPRMVEAQEYSVYASVLLAVVTIANIVIGILNK